MRLLFLAAGGVLGTLSRYFFSGFVYERLGSGFPHGTLFVNALGCFLIGFLGTVAEEKFLIGSGLRTFLFIGFLGAFTTFSTFAYESWQFVKDGEFLVSAVNVVISVVLSFFMLWVGAILARLL